jgi:urease beta subunit
MIPGEYILAEGDIEGNVGRVKASLTVVNTGDRPVQVGSHFHFFEVNRQLAFDRAKAFGMRLNIPAGTAVRFEPGEEKEVPLVRFGGEQKIYGFSSLAGGGVTSEKEKKAAMEKALEQNFKNKAE